MTEIEPLALFDMDGTLCDFDEGLFKELELLRSPNEPVFHPPVRDNVPDYLKARRNLITSSSEWWANLPKFQLGWDILNLAKELDFNIMILTQGPRKNPASWAGKKMWIDKNLGPDTNVTITRDKGLVYGKVLVDDYPEYIERWLSWRENGLVIMPANDSNKDFKHPQVIRYDGSNLEQVKKAMQLAFSRKRSQHIDFSNLE